MLSTTPQKNNAKKRKSYETHKKYWLTWFVFTLAYFFLISFGLWENSQNWRSYSKVFAMVGLLLLENHLSSPNWRETFYGTIFYSTAGHKIENQLLSFNSKNGSISEKKKVERSRRVFWQLHAIFWTTIVEAPIIFVIKIFFFMWVSSFTVVGNLIWHSLHNEVLMNLS